MDNSMVDDLVAKMLDDDVFVIGSGPNDCLSGYVHKILFISNLCISLSF
jgi:hypothetical protein